MEKVICIKCGSSGYTASPRHVSCTECGGKYKVVDEGRGDTLKNSAMSSREECPQLKKETR